MADTFTSRLLLRKPEPGTNTNVWGPLLNEDFGSDRVEEALTGIQSYTLSGPKTLTRVNGEVDEARMRIQNITGGTGGTITIPAVQIWYLFRNGSSGNLTISNGSNSVVIRSGNQALVLSDGTNIYQSRILDFGAEIPKSSGTPTVGEHLVNKTYADGVFSAPLAAAESARDTAGAAASSASGSASSASGSASAAASSASSASTSATNAANSAASINPSNYVQTTGAQTVAGLKTFSNGVRINGNSLTALTAFGLSLAEAADAAAVRTLIGVPNGSTISSLAASSSPTIAFTSIPATHNLLVLAFRGIDFSTNADLMVDISTDGTTWIAGTAGINLIGGVNVGSGGFFIPGYQAVAGIARLTMFKGSGNQLTADGGSSSTLNFEWALTGGISAVRLRASTGNIIAGTAYLVKGN